MKKQEQKSWGNIADDLIGHIEKKTKKMPDNELCWCLEYVIDSLEMKRNSKLKEMGELE